MCRVGDDHLLAWSGGDRHLKVMAARGGRFGSPVRLEETSHHAPALCPYGDSRVLLAWTGTDTRINVMIVGPGDASARMTFDETSAHAPALCRLGPDILLAWTGTDTRLNITRLVAG
jgi:hypothetical protein